MCFPARRLPYMRAESGESSAGAFDRGVSGAAPREHTASGTMEVVRAWLAARRMPLDRALDVFACR